VRVALGLADRTFESCHDGAGRRQRWRRLPDLSVARHSMTAAVHDGRVYVLAGAPCAGFGWTDVVESLPLPLSG
jgi:hypothetical protein